MMRILAPKLYVLQATAPVLAPKEGRRGLLRGWGCGLATEVEHPGDTELVGEGAEGGAPGGLAEFVDVGGTVRELVEPGAGGFDVLGGADEGSFHVGGGLRRGF